MKRPSIALVGRPNVGKSSLFNALCGRRHAIVAPEEGVTRDWIEAEIEWDEKKAWLVDTAGVEGATTDRLRAASVALTRQVVEAADSVILVVDGRVGLMEGDLEMVRLVRRAKKPICIAINKIDENWEWQPWRELGVVDQIAVSAAHRRNLGDLLEMAFKPLQGMVVEEVIPALKVALVGRPNVGKSSLFNKMCGSDRTLVSPIAGTTRDAVDLLVEHKGQNYLFIDTAGAQRQTKGTTLADRFAMLRTEDAIERADVCVLVADAQQGLTQEEKRLAAKIEEAGKGCVLFFNKWDLIRGFRMEHCAAAVRDESPFLAHCPMELGSALEGRRVEHLWLAINLVGEALKQRIATSQLNEFLEIVQKKQQAPLIDGKRLVIYYMTQVSVGPPSFVLFVNSAQRVTNSYSKFILNQLRSCFGFPGVPLRMMIRGKKKQTDSVKPLLRSNKLQKLDELTAVEPADALSGPEFFDETAFGGEDGLDALLDGAEGHELVDLDAAPLTDAVDSVSGLVFAGGVPPAVVMDDDGSSR
jgi:GTP-binding protein